MRIKRAWRLKNFLQMMTEYSTFKSLELVWVITVPSTWNRFFGGEDPPVNP